MCTTPCLDGDAEFIVLLVKESAWLCIDQGERDFVAYLISRISLGWDCAGGEASLPLRKERGAGQG